MKTLLFPFSLVYGVIMWVRNICFDVGIFKQHIFNTPIISVGNITTGGTGKTPIVIAIAQHYQNQGKCPAIVSRGYGRNSKGLHIVHDGNRVLTSTEIGGDEPVMMSKVLQTVPVIVCEERMLGINKTISQFFPDVIILDDAFQHRQVKRDIDIVLINASKPNDLNFVLPSGHLRESLVGLKRANAIIVTKGNQEQSKHIKTKIKHFTNAPIQFSETIIKIGKFENEEWKEKKPTEDVFVFCGIADPTSFKEIVDNNNISIAKFHTFVDHYPYTKNNIQNLTRLVQSSNCNTLLTTEKDWVKLPPSFLSQFEVYILKYSLKCELEKILFV